jgi:hypothetical protein
MLQILSPTTAWATESPAATAMISSAMLWRSLPCEGMSGAGLMIQERTKGGPTDLAECAAITGFFRAEIDRTIADLSDAYAPLTLLAPLDRDTPLGPGRRGQLAVVIRGGCD